MEIFLLAEEMEIFWEILNIFGLLALETPLRILLLVGEHWRCIIRSVAICAFFIRTAPIVYSFVCTRIRGRWGKLRLHAFRTERGAAKQRRCTVCFEDVPTLEGVVCKSDASHFLCNDCFSNHVQCEAEKGTFDGRIFCAHRTPALDSCDSLEFPMITVARHSTSTAFEAFEKSTLDLRETALIRRMEVEYHQRFEGRQTGGPNTLNLRVTEARTFVCQNILTEKCPKCKRAFVDFDGCLALACRYPLCDAYFCALCLKQYATKSEAHGHVKKCEFNRFRRSYFATAKEYKSVLRKKREKMLRAFLTTKYRDIQVDVLEACRKDLMDVDLWPL